MTVGATEAVPVGEGEAKGEGETDADELGVLVMLAAAGKEPDV
jgi:hypothetical protein